MERLLQFFRALLRHRSIRRICAQVSLDRPIEANSLSASPASLILATFVAWLVVAAGPSAGKSPGRGEKAHAKLDRHLEQVVREGASARVIVRFKKGKQEAVKKRLADRGRATTSDLASVDGFSAEIGAADIGALTADPDVLGVSTDARVTSFAEVSAAPAARVDTLTEVLGTEDLDLTADHIGIAVLDSGLYRGNDLGGGRTDKFWDFLGEGKRKAFDDYGHGTHVAGIISGDGKHSPTKRRGSEKGTREVARFRGVAPKARLLSFKVLDEQGVGYTSQVIQALEFLTENRERLKIHIVNLSLGHPILEPAETYSARAGGGGGHAIWTDRGGVGGQLRSESGDWGNRLRGHHVARERAFSDHGRCL